MNWYSSNEVISYYDEFVGRQQRQQRDDAEKRRYRDALIDIAHDTGTIDGAQKRAKDALDGK